MSNERHEKEECPPIYCDPQYVVHDTYVPRYVPYVHPIIHVNRKNIVNVPKHVFQESYENVVRDSAVLMASAAEKAINVHQNHMVGGGKDH